MSDEGLDGLDLGIIGGWLDPAEALHEIVRRLHATPEPDVDVISHLGVGPLESLFHHGHEEELWPEIEELARHDERFRRALANAWAYDSPMFERREALLAELGESQPVRVSFVVYPEDFAAPPQMDYRALHIDGTVPGGQLPRMLREIADALEREDADQQPALWWDRSIRHVLRPWMDARGALKRALHQLDVSDASTRRQALDEADRCRRVEAEAWIALRDAAISDDPSDA